MNTQASIGITDQSSTLRKNFFLFIIIVLIISIISFTSISVFSIYNSLNKVYSKLLTKKTGLISKTITTYIESDLIALKDLTNLPIIVNSVMHPEHDHSFLKDFMIDTKIQGKNMDLWLLDINGKTVQTSSTNNQLPYSPNNWIDPLIEGEVKHIVRLYKKENPYIFFAVPVHYNKFPEGILVGIIESNLDSFFKTIIDEKDFNLHIVSNNNLIHSTSKTDHRNHFINKFDIPLFNGHLKLEVSKNDLNEALINLFILIIATTCAVSLILLLPIKKVGAYLIVKPQEEIERSREETQNVNIQLSIANDELKQFAYRTSHDLKAPMSTIIGLCDFIIEDIEDNEHKSAIVGVQKVKNNSNKLIELTTNILELAEIDKLEVKRKNINIKNIINDIESKLELLIKENNVTIELDENHDTPLLTQETRISQIIDNLISNSVKYCNFNLDNRFVKVSTTNTSNTFTLTVEDNGIGIPQEYQSEIYNMFTRFHSNKASGSGLGMYILKKHIDYLEANIVMTSSIEGTTFKVDFPLI